MYTCAYKIQKGKKVIEYSELCFFFCHHPFYSWYVTVTNFFLCVFPEIFYACPSKYVCMLYIFIQMVTIFIVS